MESKNFTNNNFLHYNDLVKTDKKTGEPLNLKVLRTPLVEVVYEKIQDAVSQKHLVEGQRIYEAEISKWLNVSRTPVRDALRRLVEKDVLCYDRYGNLIVTVIDSQMIQDVYHMRQTLDSMGARLAAQRRTKKQAERLTNLAEKYDDLTTRSAHLKINRLFHATILEAANNRYLTRAYSSLPYPISTFFHWEVNVDELMKIRKERQSIALHILNSDPEKSEEAAKIKVQTSMERWLDRVASRENDLLDTEISDNSKIIYSTNDCSGGLTE